MNTSVAPLYHVYRKADALLAAGELQQSAEMCRQILDADPNYAYGHHLMAALFRHTGNLDKALAFSQMAIRLDPTVPLFHLQQGQIYYELKHWPEATTAFAYVHKIEPQNPIPLMLSADAFARQKKYDEAIALFAQARRAQDIPEIDEHEGIFLLMKGEIYAAEQLFDRLITLRPDYYAGYIHKGKILFDRAHDIEAEASFVRALECNADADDAHYYIALIKERQGLLAIAAESAMLACNRRPTSARNLLLLGLLLERAGNASGAEQVFRQALVFEPLHMDTLYSMVQLLVRQKRITEAQHLIEKALCEQQGQGGMHYLRAALNAEKKQAAPSEYIAELFDSLADRYDYHWQKALGYHLPEVMAASIQALPGMQERMPCSLLDLGCGTGLLSQAMQGICGHCVGVDLSSEMLAKARAKELYAELHDLDIVEFAMGYDGAFDIVAAAEVLTYSGNIVPFLQSARNAMKSDGLLVFSIQPHAGNEPCRLSSAGCYTYSSIYIESLAENEGYRIIKNEPVSLREENLQVTDGRLFILQKTPVH